ncbi:peptidoglycan-binding protein [Streptomyces sp. PTD5-9]|uniref:peptidoglycan-binding protein n=1 Tax=Streptomyces sp. PTD5-9 TaxID=3120150 RepID=UPI00300B43A7
MTGHICPECGMRMFSPTAVNGASDADRVCACGGRAARRHDERREAAEHRRTERWAAGRAEIAAAEDFDPLRVRPYVKLGGDVPPEAGGAPVPHSGRSPHRPAGDADSTMPLFFDPTRDDGPAAAGGPSPFAAQAGPGEPARPGGGLEYVGGPSPETAAPVDATVSLPPVPAVPAGTPSARHAPTPVLTDTTVLGSADGSARPRRRPLAALTVGAAAVAVVGTALFAGGLFDPKGDGAADRELALPDLPPSTLEASTEAEESAPATAPPTPSGRASAPPSASATAPSSAGTSPSPSASATAARPNAAEPSATAPRASLPPSAEPPASLAGPALRAGDRGPAVAELQRRLEEIWLFHGRDDGSYTDQVEHAVRVYQSYKFIQGDPPGVYGPHTRRALEAETSGRGRA